jgi:two-component system, response regulator
MLDTLSDKVILLVEDDVDTAELTLRALRKAEVVAAVTVARDGEEARDWLFGLGAFVTRDVRQVPHLIVLDINLPKVNGLDLLRLIRTQPRTKHVPIVMFSSSVEDAERTRGYSLGANSYVRKPVDFGEFAEAVRLMARYWLGVNVPAPAG